MTVTIAIATLKGGSGKTIVATNLASTLHADGHRVLLVDADEQHSSVDWKEDASNEGIDAPPVISLRGATFRKEIARIGESYDVVIIAVGMKPERISVSCDEFLDGNALHSRRPLHPNLLAVHQDPFVRAS